MQHTAVLRLGYKPEGDVDSFSSTRPRVNKIKSEVSNKVQRSVCLSVSCPSQDRIKSAATAAGWDLCPRLPLGSEVCVPRASTKAKRQKKLLEEEFFL